MLHLTQNFLLCTNVRASSIVKVSIREPSSNDLDLDMYYQARDLEWPPIGFSYRSLFIKKLLAVKIHIYSSALYADNFRERERERGIKMNSRNKTFHAKWLSSHFPCQEVHAKWLGEMGWNSLRMESCAPFNRGEIRLNSLCVESNVWQGGEVEWNSLRVESRHSARSEMRWKDGGNSLRVRSQTSFSSKGPPNCHGFVTSICSAHSYDNRKCN